MVPALLIASWTRGVFIFHRPGMSYHLIVLLAVTCELVEQLRHRFTRSLSENNTAGRQMGYTLAGIVLGMLTSMCCIILIKILQAAVSSLAKQWNSKKHLIRSLRRACLLVAYFSAVAWLLLQYQKIIGLKQLYIKSTL